MRGSRRCRGRRDGGALFKACGIGNGGTLAVLVLPHVIISPSALRSLGARTSGKIWPETALG